jgi:hypothetical protein
VHVRRDPLLVTSSGRDRVMVQCFPIEPNGEMKVRIGITAPIVPEQVSDRGVLGLPALIGRNFDPGGNSSVWLESRGEFVPADRFEIKAREDGVRVMKGAFDGKERAAVRLSGLAWEKTWARERADSKRIIEQRFVERAISPPNRVIIVIDGSESMRGRRNEIGTALTKIPAGIEKRTLVATRTGVADWDSAVAWEGGVDAVPALEAALHESTRVPGTTVV